MKPQINVLRRAVRGVMTAQCRITKPGPWEWDPDLGQSVQTEETVYEGACWMRPAGRSPKETTAAGTILGLTDYEVWAPTSVILDDGEHHLYLTESFRDPGLVGKKFTVITAVLDDWQIYRHLVCQRAEVTP